MELGAFSVSLAVKDFAASRAFYQTLGFSMFGGDEREKWLIMKNGDHTIGLFEGMFDKNILTFQSGLGSGYQRTFRLYRCARDSESAAGAGNRLNWRGR